MASRIASARTSKPLQEEESKFANNVAQIEPAAADRALRDDLLHLKMLGLADFRRHGRGAARFLTVELSKPSPHLSSFSTSSLPTQ
jgi:hypothetical protein